MFVKVLIPTMNRTSDDIDELIEKMNIQTEAVVVNQAKHTGSVISDYVVKTKNNKIVRVINSKGTGIGNSRNRAFLASSGGVFAKENDDEEILLFADDDIHYVDGYEDIVINEFKEIPEADMLVFNARCLNNNDGRVKDKPCNTIEGVHWFNCLRYGTIRMAVKKKFLEEHNIWFSLEHGGGTKYGFGEDTLFIHDCLKAGAKIYTTPATLCEFSYEDSSWFQGYDEKWFNDEGVLFKRLYGRNPVGFLFLLAMIVRSKDKWNGAEAENALGLKIALKLAVKGYKSVK